MVGCMHTYTEMQMHLRRMKLWKTHYFYLYIYKKYNDQSSVP